MQAAIAPPPPIRAAAPAPPTSAAAVHAARPEVFQLLMRTPAFLSLGEEERRRIAQDTVRVLSYMADPNGVQAEIAEREASGDLPRSGALAAAPAAAPVPLAGAMVENAVDATKRQLSQSPGFSGRQFVAGGVREGVEGFGQMVQKVDFPKFVGGLIKNVFQAIVESSIEQMRAYGDLIANVAKTTDQFMRDNISESAGRDYLADSYPDVFEISFGNTADQFADGEGAEQPGSKLETKLDDAMDRLLQISRDLEVNPPVNDVSDADAELRLVTGARLQMAKSRQQLLSSMVMLGINRIVVTDGSINAKVIFDMRGTSVAGRKYTASMHDMESQRYKESINASYGSWYTPVSVDANMEGQQDHVATVGSALDETSEDKAEVKAKLSGEVRVNFKSDYLPLDKMATPEMMSVIQGNSTPYNPNSKPAAGAGAGG